MTNSEERWQAKSGDVFLPERVSGVGKRDSGNGECGRCVEGGMRRNGICTNDAMVASAAEATAHPAGSMLAPVCTFPSYIIFTWGLTILYSALASLEGYSI